MNFWELQSDLSWKDAASSIEEITQNIVNYLPRRKSEHLHDVICI